MKMLEHPDVGVMRRRLDWQMSQGFIRGYSWLRWTPSGVKYSFTLMMPIKYLRYIMVLDMTPDL